VKLVDRAAAPLAVPDDKVARACGSPPLPLYYLQRSVRQNAGNQRAIVHLLGPNSRLRRIHSAHGLLTSVAGELTDADAGRWGRKLAIGKRRSKFANAEPPEMRGNLDDPLHRLVCGLFSLPDAIPVKFIRSRSPAPRVRSAPH
jgi:hypothetical protein